MNSFENRGAMVEIVFATAEVEVNNVDRIDLAHLVIPITKLDVFCDGFRDTVEDPL